MKDAILWWMVENQNRYRADAIERMSRMSDGQRTARPGAGLHSPLWLLVHLAEIERHYLAILADERTGTPMHTVPSDQPEPDPWPVWRELLNFVRETRRQWIQRVRALDEASLGRQYGRQSYLTGAWIVAHVFEHESFHMGQLRWGLRMVSRGGNRD